jgi:hypothetical protein
VSLAKSNEATESKKAVTLAIEAAADAGGGVEEFWTKVQATWNEALGDLNTVTATDEYFARIWGGITSVLKSQPIKESLSGVGKNANKSTTEVGFAASLISKKFSDELGVSDKWSNSIKAGSESASLLLSVLTVAGKRSIGAIDRLDRQLPK